MDLLKNEREAPKREYVPPRVVVVQRRVDGDNLSTGCKSALVNGAGTMVCAVTNCSTLGS